MVLPFVEQQPLYDQINWNTAMSMRDPINNQLAQTVVSTFLVPVQCSGSDPHRTGGRLQARRRPDCGRYGLRR